MNGWRVQSITTLQTYGSAKTPGVSSWEEAHPEPEFITIVPCGQSARRPSQTPRQDASLQYGSLPTVSAAKAFDG